jgi:oligopeptidase B
LAVAKLIAPPLAKVENKVFKEHGQERVDSYFWMRERDSKAVVDYLKAENKYAETWFSNSGANALKEKLFKEIKSRIVEEDSTVPFNWYGTQYFRQIKKGQEYWSHYRRKEGKSSLIIDFNKEAKGKKYFKASSYEVSFNNRYFAYAYDEVGRRINNIRFLDLNTGRRLPQIIEEVTPSFVWAKDNETLFYVKQDKETLRPFQLYRYNLLKNTHELVYEESDPLFSISVYHSASRNFIFLDISSSETSEARYLKADAPFEYFKIFEKRKFKHLYSLEDAGDNFLVLSNDRAINFRVFTAAYDNHSRSKWKERISHHKMKLLTHWYTFKDYVVMGVRENGQDHFKVYSYKDWTSYPIDIPLARYVPSFQTSTDFELNLFRYSYESLAQPEIIFEMNLATKEKKLLKERKVPGKFNSLDYEISYIEAPSRDKKNTIPITLIKHKKTKFGPQSPLYLYGYGSYGYTIQPYFDASLISLLDRGFVYAIAHIRGGAIKGRQWYLDGKYLKKKNSFYDYIDVTKHLMKEYKFQANKTFGTGRSAGGLLMGAVANEAPQLYKALVVGVPFVDVLNTMLDASLPLTVGEYEEWGNPHEKKYYDYIRSYSPYENVKKQSYPQMFIFTGYHDSQVQYWEPAKWVAQLRAHQSSPENKILFKTDMSSGHSGQAGRYQSLMQIAEQYAYILSL